MKNLFTYMHYFAKNLVKRVFESFNNKTLSFGYSVKNLLSKHCLNCFNNILNCYNKKNIFIIPFFTSTNKKSVIFNRNGFSIVAVLIAAAIGVFIMIALTKSQFMLLRNTKKIESKMIALELTKEIISTLEAPPSDCAPPCIWSKSSCTNTLEGFNDVAGTEAVRTAILSMTDTSKPTPSAVYSVSKNYNGVQIKEMKIVAGNTGDDIVILRVWFETDEDISRGIVSPEMARPFDIYAKVNYVGGSTTVESCTAVITSYSTFSGKRCGDNEYLKGFDNIGIMECIPLPECAGNEYLKGFDSSGNKICEISQKNQSCPSGQYLRGFDINGNKICEGLFNTVTSYSIGNWCGHGACGTKIINMGAHLFCILSGIGGPGGFDTVCSVYKDGNVWKLKNEDITSAESHQCKALCFD